MVSLACTASPCANCTTKSSVQYTLPNSFYCDHIQNKLLGLLLCLCLLKCQQSNLTCSCYIAYCAYYMLLFITVLPPRHQHFSALICGALGHWKLDLWLRMNNSTTDHGAMKLIMSFHSAHSNDINRYFKKKSRNLRKAYYCNRFGVLHQHYFCHFALFSKQFISADSPSWAKQNCTNKFVVACMAVEYFGTTEAQVLQGIKATSLQIKSLEHF